MSVKIIQLNTRKVLWEGETLSGANLRNADLSGADLRSANLRNADLSGADLSGADLRSANLRNADLSGADLRSANLRCADLRSADLTSATVPAFQIPQDGSLVVWKKLKVEVLAKILVPENARRTATLIGRKCRAEWVEVLELIGAEIGYSQRNYHTEYRVGDRVVPDSYDPDIRVECSHGIHFFLTRKEAEEY